MINKPQKQEPIGVLIEIGLTIFKFVRAAWPLLLYYFIQKPEVNVAQTAWYIILFLVAILLISILRFNAFQFYIDTKNQEFVLQKGVFHKEKIIVNLDKIFEVNLEQKYLHILLGIYKVKLDTAGSDKDEIIIESLSKADSEVLRHYILHYKKEQQKPDAPAADFATMEPARDEPLAVQNSNEIKIAFFALLKNSMVSNYFKTLGIVLLFFNTIFDNIRNFNEEVLAKYLGDLHVAQTLSNSLSFTVLLFICLFLILNIAIGVFQHFGYSIQKKDESLVIKYGLVQKFQIIVRPQKVQYFIFSTSKLMKWLHINTLQLALIGDPDEKRQKNRVAIPALNSTELESLSQFLKIDHATTKLLEVIRPNYRMVIKNMAVFSVIFALITLYLYASVFIKYPEVVSKTAVLVFAFLFWMLVLLIQIISYKRYSIKLFSDKIVIKQGVLKTTTTVLPLQKIQAISQVQMWWHQTNNLSTVLINTAAGTIKLPIATSHQYSNVINYVLFVIESKNEPWA